MNCGGKKRYIWLTHVLNLHTFIMINIKHWKMFALSSMTMFKNFIQNIDIDINHSEQGGFWYFPEGGNDWIITPSPQDSFTGNCQLYVKTMTSCGGGRQNLWNQDLDFYNKKHVIYLKGYSYLSLENLDKKVFYID